MGDDLRMTATPKRKEGTKEMQIRPFQLEDEHAVVSLWQRCDLLRPWNDPHKDNRRKLRVRPDLFLVGVWTARLLQVSWPVTRAIAAG